MKISRPRFDDKESPQHLSLVKLHDQIHDFGVDSGYSPKAGGIMKLFNFAGMSFSLHAIRFNQIPTTYILYRIRDETKKPSYDNTYWYATYLMFGDHPANIRVDRDTEQYERDLVLVKMFID
jgi:hypothetical protein